MHKILFPLLMRPFTVYAHSGFYSVWKVSNNIRN